MTILLSPVLNEQQFDANGNPLAGGMIYTYLAGTTTPVTTYKTSTGTAHTNPIVLDSSGNYPTGTQLWLDSGKTYKFVVQNSVGSTLRTIDNITPINDVSSGIDEWVQYTASTFAYLTASSFSVAGDQTGIFQVNRRVRTTNTGGTAYGNVLTSTYSAPNTTVTLQNTSGTLDAGLSAVYYGLLSVTNPSVPSNYARIGPRVDVATATNIDLTNIGDDIRFTGVVTPSAFTIPIGRRVFAVAQNDFQIPNNASIVTNTGGALAVRAGDSLAIRSTATNVVEVLLFAGQATAAQRGQVELATDAEAQTGTDATRALTPANLNATVPGMGQTLNNVTVSRAFNTDYVNGSRVRFLNVTATTTSGSSTGNTIGVQVNGGAQVIGSGAGGVGVGWPLSVVSIIPPGATYRANCGNATLGQWLEYQ